MPLSQPTVRSQDEVISNQSVGLHPSHLRESVASRPTESPLPVNIEPLSPREPAAVSPIGSHDDSALLPTPNIEPQPAAAAVEKSLPENSVHSASMSIEKDLPLEMKSPTDVQPDGGSETSTLSDKPIVVAKKIRSSKVCRLCTYFKKTKRSVLNVTLLFS